MNDYKIVLGIVASAMTIYAYIPYIRGILKGQTKPHLFSWIIWLTMTAIAVTAQIYDNAGAGSWPVLVALAITLFVTLLAFKSGHKEITKFDWIMLMVGLSAIPLWVLTSNPTWSAIIATGVHLSASAPTFRKSWSRPQEEVPFTYGLNALRYCIALAALNAFTVATVVYPAGCVAMNAGLLALLLVRRKAVR